ncbi:tetratricopeptide repeat protein [Planctomicrobium sp. SH661]|uniref:tetratricopeptide repeat protein n=1 Tax=Planctomicrobium sp. SH661 TaxID=3448124 RepID=UPI003F5CB11C
MTTAEPSVDELCSQARKCISERDVDAAVELYETAIRKNPDHIAAHEGLAAICFARKEHDRAVELFKRVVKLDPKRIEPLVNLGAAYNRKGNYAEAIKTLRLAVSRDRHCATAYYNLGFAQRNAHQLSLAVSAFKESIRLEPGMWEAYINLGQILLEMKNPSQAALNFERALQLRPESVRAREGLIAARNRIDEAKTAISPFGRLVDMEEVARQNATDHKVQVLSAEQRLKDRVEVHRLAREMEQCAGIYLNQLKNELSPAILAMSRLINDQDPNSWGHGFEVLQAATERFQKMTGIIAVKLGELQSHEETIRKMESLD